MRRPVAVAACHCGPLEKIRDRFGQQASEVADSAIGADCPDGFEQFVDSGGSCGIDLRSRENEEAAYHVPGHGGRREFHENRHVGRVGR